MTGAAIVKLSAHEPQGVRNRPKYVVTILQVLCENEEHLIQKGPSVRAGWSERRVCELQSRNAI